MPRDHLFFFNSRSGNSSRRLSSRQAMSVRTRVASGAGDKHSAGGVWACLSRSRWRENGVNALPQGRATVRCEAYS
ncbi:hypothetical protein E2C01_018844 [Portunus trituberculatus]|uniref:Uncharacterized protein n=1 Tax=Portunus trituberculatus TaxID=210409 RepID=A0A5B7DVK3_PORTR|nr:hypothetical protein [Portunus trituberculatus]